MDGKEAAITDTKKGRRKREINIIRIQANNGWLRAALPQCGKQEVMEYTHTTMRLPYQCAM